MPIEATYFLLAKTVHMPRLMALANRVFSRLLTFLVLSLSFFPLFPSFSLFGFFLAFVQVLLLFASLFTILQPIDVDRTWVCRTMQWCVEAVLHIAGPTGLGVILDPPIAHFYRFIFYCVRLPPFYSNPIASKLHDCS